MVGNKSKEVWKIRDRNSLTKKQQESVAQASELTKQS
jgi:hypothetical protein